MSERVRVRFTGSGKTLLVPALTAARLIARGMAVRVDEPSHSPESAALQPPENAMRPAARKRKPG